MRILRTLVDYVNWLIIFHAVIVVALDQKYAYQTILAADIGGTFTRLSLIEMGKPWRNLSVMRTSERYINSQYSSFEDIMTAFLSKAGTPNPCLYSPSRTHLLHTANLLRPMSWSLSQQILMITLPALTPILPSTLLLTLVLTIYRNHYRERCPASCSMFRSSGSLYGQHWYQQPIISSQTILS